MIGLRVFKEIFHEFNPDCLECGTASKSIFCFACEMNLRFESACAQCGVDGLARGLKICLPCQQKGTVGKSLSIAYWYRKGPADLLHRMKNGLQPEWYTSLLDLNFNAPVTADGIVVVPSDPRAYQKRMFDTSKELAQVLARKWGMKFLGQPFERTPFFASQKKLSLGERREFIRRSLKLKECWKGRRFERLLLVDDLVTTGASLEIAAELLSPLAQEIHTFGLFRAPKAAS